MPEFVTLDVADGIGTIRIARPPVNALDLQSHRELRAAAAEAAERTDVAAVIVHGGEKMFAAGDDVRELMQFDAARMTAMAPDLQAALGAIATIPKPTVAAISNYALGGGLEVALGADRRIAGDNAKFGLPEVLLGLIPGGGATQRLARLIGPSKAKDLIFTGRFVEADEALRIGLIDQVVAPDDVYTAARDWAAQFVGGPARALAAAKVSIDVGLSGDLPSGLELERQQFAALFDTADAATGMRSFLDDGPGRASFTGE